MFQSQNGGVKSRTRESCGIRGQGFAVKRAVVYLFPAKRRAVFAEVNPHLVRAAGLQLAFHESEISQDFKNANVSHSPFSAAGFGGLASAAVPAIAYKPGLQNSAGSPAADDRQIFSFNRVQTELTAEIPGRVWRSGKYHQPAGFLVQSMYRNYLVSAVLFRQHWQQ